MNLTDEQCELMAQRGPVAIPVVKYLDFVIAGLSPRDGVVCAGGCGVMIKVGPDADASRYSMVMVPKLDNMMLCHSCYGEAKIKGNDLRYDKMKEVWKPWL